MVYGEKDFILPTWFLPWSHKFLVKVILLLEDLGELSDVFVKVYAVLSADFGNQ